jgi:hypothetical protein
MIMMEKLVKVKKNMISIMPDYCNFEHFVSVMEL